MRHATYSTYSEIGGPDGHLANQRPFTGNSMSARWLPGGRYVVFSYTTEIAREVNGTITYNEQRYSATTTRHQNLCRAWLVPVHVASARLRESVERQLAVIEQVPVTIERELAQVTLIGPAAGAELRALVYG